MSDMNIQRCENTVYMRGSLTQLESVFDACKSKTLFEYLYPIGDHTIKDALDRWGVPWEPLDIKAELDMRNEKLKLVFVTPYVPPVSVYYNGEINRDIFITGYYFQEEGNFTGYYEQGREHTYRLDFTKDGWSNLIDPRVVRELDLSKRHTDYLNKGEL